MAGLLPNTAETSERADQLGATAVREGALLKAFRRVREGLTRREDNLFLFLAVLLGAFSGVAVVCFRLAIEFTRVWLLGSGLHPAAWRTLVAPTLGGIIVAFLVTRYFPRSRGTGVTQTKSAVYIYDGYIPFGTVLQKFFLCSLAIGSGHSLGPEDPSLQIGAGMASALGRRLQLSREKLRLLAPVGAAAGLAAAFNSPIAAVIFVIEEVVGTWSAGILGAIVLAAVSSVVVMRLFLGAEPMFRVPTYTLAHPAELLTYAILGLVGGLASIVFAQLLAFLRPRLKSLPHWTYYLQPGAAGLIIGVIGLRFPQIMGAGYEYIDQAMHGAFIWQVLIALAILKIVATSLSLASGTPGGMFAPTLFIGAMIGGAVGAFERHFVPGIAGPIGAYALVGMGTLFAGFLRVPMTSVFMVVEVSGNYSIILPVIIANTLAYFISRRFQPVPIFDLLTRQDGLNLPSMEEAREQATLIVEEAMQSPSGPILRAPQTVASAAAQVGGSSEEAFLVSYETGRWALINKSALRDAVAGGKESCTLREILPAPRLPRLHPDQPLDLALRLLRDMPFLPVVHRADATKLIGVLSQNDILNTYRRLTKLA
jgi:chloride channel protein, CIC family